jgi:hypothetical protein
MNASQEGFYLEELIYNAVTKFPVLTKNLRELQIKQHFKDNSLNGVDHWIKFGKNNILIQDKWKEDTSQQEVSQFLECATRINRRIPRDETIYLLWASKNAPTKHSTASLNERGAEIISCNLSIQALARLVILRIADCLDIDCVPALLSIPKDPSPIPMERASVSMDTEALEILAIRKELDAKKKKEKEDNIAEELHVRELLLSEPALSWKMKVSINLEPMLYHIKSSNCSGIRQFQPWNPSEPGKSAKEMLVAFREILAFRSIKTDDILARVKQRLDILWNETDEEIFGREQIQKAGGNGWSYPNVEYYLGTNDKQQNDEDYWQTHIINEIGKPLFTLGYNKWYGYCQTFLERSKGKPRLHELQKTIQILTDKNELLKKENEEMEQKLQSIRNACR